MKNSLLLLLAIAIPGFSFGDGLTGTKTIPGDYTSLSEAISDLNTQGVGSGGITFNVAAGYTEILTAPISVTATGTLANPIIFQKNGSGSNPLLTAYVGAATPSSAVQDGLWNLVGSDYVTIDGIDLFDPNSTNPATMEYGYTMFMNGAGDGCQNNTIKNCVVTLSKVNNTTGTMPALDGSRAINVVNALVSAQTTVVVPASASGTNSYNKFYSNTLQNCNIGIALNGYAAATPFTLGDTGNDIGGTILATGNTVLNFGGATGATNPAAGIRANNQWGINISWNTINNNNGSGVNHPSTLRGIFAQAGLSANATITHNNITISGGGTSSSVYGIDNGIGSTAASNIVDINYNSVTGSYATATTGIFYAIQNTASAATVNVTYNTVSGISTPGTGSIYGMVLGSPIVLNINYNNIGSLTKTGIGTIYGINPSTATITCQNNTVDGLVCSAASSNATIYGIYDGASAVTEIYSNNIVRNLSSTGIATLYGLYINTATGNKTVQDNQIYNLNKTGGGNIYGINLAYGAADIISNNQVHDFNITGTTSGTIYGIRVAAGSNNSLYTNTINALSNAGGSSGAVYGFYISTGTTNNLYRNQVFNLSSGSTNPTLYGIYLLSGTTNNVYNNFISDLRTTAASALIPLAGIYVGGGTTDNIFFNSIYLSASSSGANFGSAALYASTTPTLDLRNNILVNVSVPNGTGVTAAYRRSSTTLTTYSANSNANSYYSGVSEDATHAVYFDGTTPYSISAFKTLVGPLRDGISFRELTPFANVATTPYNMHMQPGVTTMCESGGLSVSSPITIISDIDGDTRMVTPDIGADEFESIINGPLPPSSYMATAISSQQINLSFYLNPDDDNVIIVWNTTGTFTVPVGVTPAVGSAFAGGTVLSNGTISPVAHSGLNAATMYYYRAFSYDGYFFSRDLTVACTPNVSSPSALTATPISASQIDLAYTLNAQANNVIIATNSTSSFGVPINGTAYAAGNSLPTASTVIYVGPLAAFSNSGLSPNTAYYYKVWSVDAFNYYSATGITANATTLCGNAILPFTENFDSYTPPSVGCGIVIDANADEKKWATTSGTTYNGSNKLSIGYSAAGVTMDDWYITQGFNLTGGQTYEVRFWYRAVSSTYTERLEVKFGTSANAAGMNSNAVFTAIDFNNAAYTQGYATFCPSTSGVYYAGWHCFSLDDMYGIYLDQITIEVQEGCPRPLSVNATAISSSGISISWTGVAPIVQIDYGAVGHIAGSGTMVSGVVSNPATISGLVASTTYDVYVRQDCGSGQYSSWVGPVSVTTLCASTSLPYNQSFGASSIPACWTMSGPQAWLFNTTWSDFGADALADHSNNFGNYAGVDGSGTAGLTGITLLSQMISIATPSRGAYVSFYLFNNNISSTLLADEQKLSLDIWDGSAWHNGAFVWGYGQNAAGWQYQMISICGYTITGPIQLRFVVDKGTNYPYFDDIIIDDVVVEYIESCAPPFSLTATPGIYSADLGWTPTSGEYSWDIEVGPAGFTPTGYATHAGVTNPYHLTGLSASTSYSYYVKANCGNSCGGNWAGPLTFTTLAACPAPTTLMATGITTSSAIIGWTETGTATSWDIEYGLAGFGQGNGTSVSGISKPYTLTNLASGTSYSYYVRAICGTGNYSLWTGPFYFNTLCSTVYLPLNVSFENPAFPPPCWSNTAVNGTAIWTRSSSASGNGSGIGSAFANFYSQDQTQVYDLISPSFEPTICSFMPLLSFDYAYATYAGEVDEMDVYYSTDYGTTWTLLLAMPGGATGILNTGGTIETSFVPSPSQWGTKNIFLPAGTNRLKFRAISAFGNNLYLDNIQLQSTETARDLEAVSIDLNQVVAQGTVTPKATVRNNGLAPETFDVTMTIGSYSSTETITSLAPGATQQVLFSPWSNSVGDCSATVTTYSFCGDINPANNTVTKAIKVMALDKTVYAWTTFNATNNGALSFNLNEPGTLTEIVNEYPVTSYPSAATWANNSWYAAIYNSSSPYYLVTFDPTTGARTVIGDLGININALSYNTSNSTMYGIGYDGVNSILYSINTNSASITYIGTITSRLIMSLAINNAGEAYSVDQNTDLLGTVNLSNASFTPIGSVGFDANDAQDMEFDRETGELFMAAFVTTGELRWVDKVSGNTLLIGQFQAGHKLTGFAIPYISDKTLNVTVILEGLYNGGGTMRKARNGTGDQFPGSTADQVNIELHDELNYSTVVYSINNVNMSISGLCVATVPDNIHGSYYITIRHRNSIQTTTATPVSFAASIVNYAFDLPVKAFGNNLQLMTDGQWVIFGGDVNQDGLLDSGDMTGVDNDTNNFVMGYVESDANGDGLIDSGDMTIIDNNVNAFVSMVLP